MMQIFLLFCLLAVSSLRSVVSFTTTRVGAKTRGSSLSMGPPFGDVYYRGFEKWCSAYAEQTRIDFPDVFRLPEGVYEVEIARPLGIVFEEVLAVLKYNIMCLCVCLCVRVCVCVSVCVYIFSNITHTIYSHIPYLFCQTCTTILTRTPYMTRIQVAADEPRGVKVCELVPGGNAEACGLVGVCGCVWAYVCLGLSLSPR
ncbi:hypothetical protein B484DRAFT_50945 [Ochromonadaceae sp. CCMP2298]|nr:hypothetical protein B484DRAFT_50945 [Ochromonadaceae sp. CCMP2298]